MDSVRAQRNRRLANLVILLLCAGGASFSWLFRDAMVAYIFEHVSLDTLDPVLKERFSATVAVLVAVIIVLLVVRMRAGMIRSLGGEGGVTEEMVSDLMLSREQFRMLYDTSPVPYFLMDDRGTIHDPNLAALRFLQGTKEECVAVNFFKLFLEDKDSNKVGMLRTKVDRSVSVHNEEYRVRTLKDKERYVLVSVYSIDRSSHIPFKHLVTLIDVTEEREQEQVKTDFLLLASHQLRTPLTAVKWHVDYLLTTKSLEIAPEVRTYLNEIYAGSERMIDIISTLLTVSRIEMGTLAPEFAKVSVREVVQDLLVELIGDMKKKNILPQFTVEGDDVITTDRTMFRIAIHNLLTNATKYSPNGGNITITCTFSSKGGDIAVADTGYGIPDNEQGKIFSKLYRASNAKKVSANGTGLGLYLTKSFVEKLGGTIQFSSTEGAGTTFTLHVPRVAPGA